MSPYFHDIDPIAFSLGPVAVHWYGIMYLLGFAGAWFLGDHRRRQGRLPVSYEAFSDLAFYVMLGVILGGRIWYMLSYVSLDWIVHDPLAIFRVWDGGMSFHGGLLGVLLAGWIWSRRNRIHFFDTIDFVAPLVPIGLGLGRLGNFINGELWGKLTTEPWGVIFPNSLENLNKTREELHRMYLAGQLNGEARHPSQLYEFALEGVVMFAALYVFSMKPRPRYAVSGLFALMYGVFRFAVEFVRIPDAQLGYLAFGWLTMGQIQSLPLIVIGLVLLWLSRRAPTLRPDAAAANPPAEPKKEAA
ncbi:MAG: prolipoprotein diacylglyceryl transferase [Rudaea sp.]|uniref:prolipoprotein diacylglyceryl transferase n=1 Tax=Rudaea sp. TaxID=2136325 RepID=UPI0039E64813